MRHAPVARQSRCLCRSVAVEVGFEPTEDLRLHTLSSTAYYRSPACASVRDQPGQAAADAGEPPRTRMNETKTEPKARRREIKRFLIAGGRCGAKGWNIVEVTFVLVRASGRG